MHDCREGSQVKFELSGTKVQFSLRCTKQRNYKGVLLMYMKRLKERGFEKCYFIHHYHWEGFNGLSGQRIIKPYWMENPLMSCSHVGLPSLDRFIRSPSGILQVSVTIFVFVCLFIFEDYTQKSQKSSNSNGNKKEKKRQNITWFFHTDIYTKSSSGQCPWFAPISEWYYTPQSFQHLTVVYKKNNKY